MREYKFRYVFKHFQTGEIRTKIITITEMEENKWGDIPEWEDDGFHLESRDPFTGLKDRIGTEIYAGDILHDKRFDSGIGKVYFDTELGVWKVGFHEEDWLYEFYDCSEVIGNRWDNPELLGG